MECDGRGYESSYGVMAERSIHICFEKYQLDYTTKRKNTFIELYNDGCSTKSIAKRFLLDRISVELLMLDLLIKGEIKHREGGADGTKEYKATPRKKRQKEKGEENLALRAAAKREREVSDTI